MLALVALLIFAGLVALIIWGAAHESKKATANLTALASRLGLQLMENKVTLGTERVVRGAQQGREVRFWTYTTGSGKSRRSWAAVGVKPRASGMTLEFQRQGFGTKLMEMFGSKEVVIGDEAFDREWFLQTNQPEMLQAALVPEIRAKLMAQPQRANDGTYKVASDGWVQFSEQGSFSSGETIARLEAKLPLLHDLADVVEVCSGK